MINAKFNYLFPFSIDKLVLSNKRMKKVLSLLFVMMFALTTFAQQAKTDYLKKSKKQKTTAWMMLVGGTVVGIVGLSKINLAGSDEPINNTPGTIMFFTGLGSSIASIPLFIASKRNKKLAMNLSVRPGVIPVFPGVNQEQKPQTVLSLKINI